MTPTHRLEQPANFGPNDVTNVLPAAAFNPQGDGTYDYASNGYVYHTGGSTAFWAPVSLPNGAMVTELCVWYYNTSASTPFVEWAAYGYGSGTTAPIYHLFQSFNLPNTGAYDVACIFPNTEIHGYTDLDGAGPSEYPGYRVAAYLTATDDTQRLGGIYLRWKRQISPAPAVATFNDVGTGHPFFQFIEALASSSITAGCGGGNFCPDNPLTRGQMAVFLSKALGLHWPY